MPGASFEIVYIVTPQDIDGYGRPSCSMRRHQLPLRDGRYDEFSAHPVLNTDWVVQADVAHKIMQMTVVVSDIRRIGRTAPVSFKNPIGGLRVNGKLVDVHDGPVPGLLLDDLEDVPVEAFRADAYHVAVPLEEIA